MNRKIIYISGSGLSGSTLLDIILGSTGESMSVGELMFLPKKGILNGEYCSCGEKVPKCKFWKEVIEKWEKTRELSTEEYISIQNNLLSKGNILSTYRNLRKPSGNIKSFLDDTRILYDIIFEKSGAKTIVDSSKAPAKILILKLLGFDLQITHLIRRFGDVLNSHKKDLPKNIEIGREYEIKPRSTLYVTAVWFYENISTKLFSMNTTYSLVKYERLVKDPENEISGLINIDVNYKSKLKDRGPFFPRHLVAGNIIRMKNSIFIAEKPMHNDYQRLKPHEKVLAKFVDFFY